MKNRIILFEKTVDIRKQHVVDFPNVMVAVNTKEETKRVIAECITIHGQDIKELEERESYVLYVDDELIAEFAGVLDEKQAIELARQYLQQDEWAKEKVELVI